VLLETAKAAKVDGQRLSLWLTSQEVEHATVNSEATALAALCRLTPAQAAEMDGWLSDQAKEAA
jgi:hypothetical protein